MHSSVTLSTLTVLCHHHNSFNFQCWNSVPIKCESSDSPTPSLHSVTMDATVGGTNVLFSIEECIFAGFLVPKCPGSWLPEVCVGVKSYCCWVALICPAAGPRGSGLEPSCVRVWSEFKEAWVSINIGVSTVLRKRQSGSMVYSCMPDSSTWGDVLL